VGVRAGSRAVDGIPMSSSLILMMMVAEA